MKKRYFLFALLFYFVPANVNSVAMPSGNNIVQKHNPPLNGYRWDGQNARLSKAGKKKLDNLRKKIKDNKELKKQMTNMDFEYLCSKVTAMTGNPCDGRAGDTKKVWIDASKVCNLPNYCPNVPGL